MRGISRGRRNRSDVSGAPGTNRSGRRRSSGTPTVSTGQAATTRRSRRSKPGRRGEAGRWSAPGIGTGRRGRFATRQGGGGGADLLGSRRRRVRRDLRALRGFGSRETETFRFLNASSNGETKACGEERERLWARIRKADWGPADAEKVRRAERLTLLGVIDYAVLEAERDRPHDGAEGDRDGRRRGAGSLPVPRRRPERGDPRDVECPPRPGASRRSWTGSSTPLPPNSSPIATADAPGSTRSSSMRSFARSLVSSRTSCPPPAPWD